ncbi:hypothetical protein MTR_5g064943 [Medicago truncatula]|uniref:Uncharacterized protein n=1 Tax=Medicago truncatula TaxID=3880 RepID=A0A072UQH3_MEDTR|nr:hypothetical protein MTR_5g064943 [Medicago truncatula]
MSTKCLAEVESPKKIRHKSPSPILAKAVKKVEPKGKKPSIIADLSDLSSSDSETKYGEIINKRQT